MKKSEKSWLSPGIEPRVTGFLIPDNKQDFSLFSFAFIQTPLGEKVSI